MISGKILKLYGWPEGKLIGLAKRAAQKLEDAGLEQRTILDRLDSVRADPDAYLADTVMADLARECASRAAADPAAISSISKSARDEYLRQRGITLLGGGMDESPLAYKDIEAIIAVQDDLVEVVGKFIPRIVRMADEAGEY